MKPGKEWARVSERLLVASLIIAWYVPGLTEQSFSFTRADKQRERDVSVRALFGIVLVDRTPPATLEQSRFV